jgi:hypothetical protein
MLLSYRGALRAGLVYLLVSVLWIGLTQRVLIEFFDNPSDMSQWMQVRGYVWVAITALVISLICAHFARAHLLLQPTKEHRERLACWSPMPRA